MIFFQHNILETLVKDLKPRNLVAECLGAAWSRLLAADSGYEEPQRLNAGLK